jgi:hypothetical protein
VVPLHVDEGIFRLVRDMVKLVFLRLRHSVKVKVDGDGVDDN